MNLDEIKDSRQRRLFAEAYLAAKPKAGLARVSPVVQEQQAPVSRKAHNKARVSKDHGKHGRRFQVECHFYYSDKYRRDIDGAMSTTLDCLVKAGRIEDDNRFVVPRQISEGHDCPKGEERVEVTITEIKPL